MKDFLKEAGIFLAEVLLAGMITINFIGWFDGMISWIKGDKEHLWD